MQTNLENEPSYQPRSRTPKSPSVKVFLLVWILLIALGVAAAYYYSNHLKQEMVLQLQRETETQMTLLRTEYETQFQQLSQQVGELENKVQAFNELLTFTKDNATSETDNSNKLYTQLSEVKKQLNTLEKKMELLK